MARLVNTVNKEIAGVLVNQDMVVSKVLTVILAVLVIALALLWWHWPTGRAEVPTAGIATATSRWTGWRRFKVRKRVDEDAAGRYCSFYLVPENRRRLPTFEPGQYVQVRVEAPDPEHSGRMRDCIRPYYLSVSSNGRYYRI